MRFPVTTEGTFAGRDAAARDACSSDWKQMAEKAPATRRASQRSIAPASVADALPPRKIALAATSRTPAEAHPRTRSGPPELLHEDHDVGLQARDPSGDGGRDVERDRRRDLVRMGRGHPVEELPDLPAPRRAEVGPASTERGVDPLEEPQLAVPLPDQDDVGPAAGRAAHGTSARRAERAVPTSRIEFVRVRERVPGHLAELVPEKVGRREEGHARPGDLVRVEPRASRPGPAWRLGRTGPPRSRRLVAHVRALRAPSPPEPG